MIGFAASNIFCFLVDRIDIRFSVIFFFDAGIELRAVDQFKSRGGEQLVLVPSLNSSPAWVSAVAQIATRLAA